MDFLPKNEIGTGAFLKKYPNHDGRNTIIAIWDTGIDPTAAGLQVTSNGKPKILDLIDASGSGDVPLPSLVKVTSTTREVNTLTGRKVQIPKHWNPTNGLIRIGVKLAAELFPRGLLQRLRAEEKEHVWRPCIRHLAAELADCAAEGETENLFIMPPVEKDASTDEEEDGRYKNGIMLGDTTTASLSNVGASISTGTTKDKACSKTGKSKIDAAKNGLKKSQTKSNTRLLEECLTSFDRHYSQLDMVYDCFVFHDGTNWLACVDTSPYEKGKSLADMPLLADYAISKQHASFGDDTQLFYTVKIFDEGKVLQIVTNDSGHGTHVGAMAAGYFPPQDDGRTVDPGAAVNRNGVAPGAQLVSIKISDSRLGSMETGLSLLRAIRWTVELNCDVVNYSFGEYCVWPNIGRICKHLNEMVNAHGVVMVASGGNNGPSLGTVGCPGGVVDSLIGVAPLVYPEMMAALYSQPCLSNPHHEMQTPLEWSMNGDPTRSINLKDHNDQTKVTPRPSAYTWGSRGPTLDGALGLCVAAPGAANTSIASWQLRPSALLNGSSMSAPLVTGGVALLLSGLRGESGEKSFRPPPSLIRLALANTAVPVPHLSLLDQGYGVVQLDRAFAYLTNTLRLQSREARSTSRSRERSRSRSAPGPMQLPINFGWRVRCAVTGPGCVGPHRGIWLRRGWIPKMPQSMGNSSARPILRYNLHIGLDFDQNVPLEVRRRMELLLQMSVVSTTQVNEVPDPKSSTAGITTSQSNWLQVAPSVSVTSAGRDLSLVIDPNKFDGSPPKRTANTNLDTCPVIESELCKQQIITDDSSVSWPTIMGSGASAPFGACEPHVAMLNLTDASRPDLGVLTQVPIIVHFPITVPAIRGMELPRIAISDTFDALHKVRRWFIHIPPGATVGVLRLARLDTNDAACEFKITAQLPQPRSGLSTGDQEVTWPPLTLNRCGQSGTTMGRQRGVFGRRVGDDFDGASQLVFAIPWESDYVELAIAQHWGMEAPATVIGELSFRGLEPSLGQITLSSSDHYTRMVVRSNFATEHLAPHINLTHWVLPVRPTESRIIYLGHGTNERLLSKRGCYALRLTYRFTCPYKYSLCRFDLPWLHELLYDSDYLVQLYHLYDNRGRFLSAGDFDGKRSKRSKFSVTLDKGEYKVVVQICHEIGPNLNGAIHKQTDESSIINTDTNRAMTSDRVGGSTGGGTFNTDALSPLERLRRHCALIRFRLPSPGNQTSDANGPADRRGASSNVPVIFEFSAFPSSLGLNGAKPCSALDPIPIERGIGRENGVEQLSEFEALDGVDETNRRCPCLPASLCAGESTAVYIGLSDERYPAYATPGSYFAGSVELYNSDILQNVVTYPFRLLMDTPNTTSPTNSTTKTFTMNRSKTLQVGNLGLSEEDFKWLRPLRLALLPTTNLTNGNMTEQFDGGVRSAPATPLINRSARESATPHASMSVEPQSLTNGILSPEIAISPQAWLSDENQGNGTESESVSNTIDVKEIEEKEEESQEQDGLECNGVPEERPPSIIHSPSGISCCVEPSISALSECTIKTCMSPPVNEPPPVAPTQPAIKGLSSQLASLHEQLSVLDVPFRSSNSPEEQINPKELCSQRSIIWANADRLIVGRELSAMGPRSKSAPGSTSGFLHHLLTMRLVSTSQSATNENNNKTPSTQPKSSTLVAPIAIPTSPAVNQSVYGVIPPFPDVADLGDATDKGASKPPRNFNVPTSSLSIPTVSSDIDYAHRRPVDSNQYISQTHTTTDTNSNYSAKPPTVKRNGAVVFSYLELKLRLVDTLARYGRLLCERVLIQAAAENAASNLPLNDDQCVPSNPETGIPPVALKEVSRKPTSLRSGLRSLLNRVHRPVKDGNPAGLNQSHHTDSSHKDNSETEVIHTLRQIYSRLHTLLTLTATGTNSVADSLRVGSHAMPSWLLASGWRNCVGQQGTETHGEEHRAFQRSSSTGSVGGRVLMFMWLYSLVDCQFAHALRLLTRVLYQLEDPPTAALQGPITTTTSTPTASSFVRPVHANLNGSMATAREAMPWTAWLLRRFSWSDLAHYIQRQVPIVYPERVYAILNSTD